MAALTTRSTAIPPPPTRPPAATVAPLDGLALRMVSEAVRRRKAGETAMAVAHLRDASTMRPDHPATQIMLAEIMEEDLRDYEQAEFYYHGLS